MDERMKRAKVVHKIHKVVLYSESIREVNTPVTIELRQDGSVTWRDEVKR